MAQKVRRLSTMRETRVQAPGWEDPLEKEMAIHSSTLAWRIAWREEPGELQTMGSQRADTQSNFTSHSHGPVVKTLYSQCKGPSFDPWSGN